MDSSFPYLYLSAPSNPSPEIETQLLSAYGAIGVKAGGLVRESLPEMYLPTEMYREILIRVPAEPLLRARCVSKKWKRIIDDPDFRRLHVERQIGVEDMMLIRCEDSNFYSLSVESFDPPKRKNWKIEAVHRVRNVTCQAVSADCEFPMPSCHGLILLCRGQDPWVVWNPFLGDWLELPLLDEELFDTDLGGIGYDSSTNDYKVVWLTDKNKTFIYSVKLNQWHRTEDYPSSKTYDNGVYADGALYWIIYAKGCVIECIVALDLSTETYRRLPAPPFRNRHWGCSLFDSSAGCLLVHYDAKMSLGCIWILKDCGSDQSWTKLISFKYPSSSGEFRSVFYMRDKEQVLLRREFGNILLLDLGKKVGKQISVQAVNKMSVEKHFSFQVFPASLIQLPRSAEDNAVSKGTRKRKRKMVRNGAGSLKLLLHKEPVFISP